MKQAAGFFRMLMGFVPVAILLGILAFCALQDNHSEADHLTESEQIK